MFVLGIVALVLGYGLTYSGVSMAAADSNNPGVGLFQAFGVDNVVGFDLTKIADATPTTGPANTVPTLTGQTPQTTTPANPTFVSV